MHSMRTISIEKVVVNIGQNEVGDAVDKAYTLLERLTGQQPVKTRAGKQAKSFGVREGLNIGAKVTLRGKKANQFLERMFRALDYQISAKAFTDNGSFSFGIDEYLQVSDMKYDPKIGILGFMVSVSLERPGFAIQRQKQQREIGASHSISKEEAMAFVQDQFNVTVTD